jgi:hypothetical protein
MPSVSHSTGFNKKIQLCWKFCFDGWETFHVWHSCWCSHVCTVMGLSVSISTIQVRYDTVKAWTVKWYKFRYRHIVIFCYAVSWHLPGISAEMFLSYLSSPALAHYRIHVSFFSQVHTLQNWICVVTLSLPHSSSDFFYLNVDFCKEYFVWHCYVIKPKDTVCLSQIRGGINKLDKNYSIQCFRFLQPCGWRLHSGNWFCVTG